MAIPKGPGGVDGETGQSGARSREGKQLGDSRHTKNNHPQTINTNSSLSERATGASAVRSPRQQELACVGRLYPDWADHDNSQKEPGSDGYNRERFQEALASVPKEGRLELYDNIANKRVEIRCYEQPGGTERCAFAPALREVDRNPPGSSETEKAINFLVDKALSKGFSKLGQMAGAELGSPAGPAGIAIGKKYGGDAGKSFYEHIVKTPGLERQGDMIRSYTPSGLDRHSIHDMVFGGNGPINTLK